MRIACLLIPHLRAEIELQRQPELKDRPVVIIDRFARSSWSSTRRRPPAG
ncbi:MAG: hypothetical protein OXF63_10440 [Anaerolineaceae bacterium]|nr:hypothetical protein [Anaerolineaceae bacterium]